MIDLHTHILPDVDDGSGSLEESLWMAEMAAESGVRYLTATPHCNLPGRDSNYKSSYLSEVFKTLRKEIVRAEIPLKLVVGMEIFATEELPNLIKNGKVWTLNQGPYFLTEFAFDEDPGFCDYILEESVKTGCIPVIAHPERYYFVQDDPSIVEKWYRRGYGIQVNKGSLMGRFGRREELCAHHLMTNQLVSCVASDAHSPYHRTPGLREVYEMISEQYGQPMADIYCKTNPARILSGRKLITTKG
ncbi:MAG: hypothetical protein PUB22_04995 [Clostridiales bacterium]|nr:hypothetical protein [Clostridiales bacterium]